MSTYQVIGIKSPKIIDWGDNVLDAFLRGLEDQNQSLQEDDVVVITSKVVSMEEEAKVKLDEIDPSEDAMELAQDTKMDPKVVQIILDESDGEVFGGVYHALLTKTKFGLSANAGIDLSNCPEGFALLLPRDPDAFARSVRMQIKQKLGVRVAVLITDSRTIPLKRGTTGVTLGLAGMEPVIDERGKSDLYGYKMSITTRAVADNLATVANVVMGETSERMPFAVIRGVDYQVSEDEDLSMDKTMMPEDQCLYFAPFYNLLYGDDQWL